MLKYFIKRCFYIAPVLLVVSILAFAFVHALPGDPARMMAGKDADEATINMLRKELGLDLPLPMQYLNYMGKLLRGDLGKSIRTKLSVFDEIKLRYGPTMYLAIGGMFWSVVIGVLFGAVAAIKKGKWQDYTAMVISVSGISVPQFWLGLLAIQLFAVYLGLAAGGGFYRQVLGTCVALFHPGSHRCGGHGPVHPVRLFGCPGRGVHFHRQGKGSF